MRIAECPTCFCTLRPTALKQCLFGHAVCTPCREKLSSCPVCRSEFDPTATRPLLFCQVLDAFPRFCKHEGCSTLLQTGNNHEEWCGFRPITCDVLNCGTVVLADTNIFRIHLKEKHSLEPVKQGRNCVDFQFNDLPDLIESLHTVRAVWKYVSEVDFVVHYQYFEDEKLLRVVVYFPENSDIPLREKVSGTVRISDLNNTVSFKLSRNVCLLKSTTPSLVKNFPLGVHLNVPEIMLDKFKDVKGLSISTTVKMSITNVKVLNPISNTSVEMSNTTVNERKETSECINEEDGGFGVERTVIICILIVLPVYFMVYSFVKYV